MIVKMSRMASIITCLMLLLTSCESITDPPYYRLALTRGLQHKGFVLGLEKRHFAEIGTERGYSKRFQLLTENAGCCAELESRNEFFLNATRDSKKMLLTQYYESMPLYGRYALVDHYNAYDLQSRGHFRHPKLDYEAGWDAVAAFEKRFCDVLASEGPFSHVILLVMGWHTDQIEALGRINAILENIKNAAQLDSKSGSEKSNFQPLVIALTWPSAWLEDANSKFVNNIGHVLSYPVKTNDADEIGFTFMNSIIHEAVLPHSGPRPVIGIGHSFGARILSRAIFSRPHLKGGTIANCEHRATKKRRDMDLFIGLQSAFSVNRFICDDEGIEGAPYAEFMDLETRIVLTTSKHDRANPIARIATGAPNVGGFHGLKRAKERPDLFRIEKWNPDAPADLLLDEADKRILFLDAERIVQGNENSGVFGESVDGHNDVLDLEMGILLWHYIKQSARFKAPTTKTGTTGALREKSQ